MKIVIAIVTLIGFAAIVGAIYLGTQSFDGIVVEHPYERGLEWDREQRLKAELGWSLELKERKWTPGPNPLSFRISSKGGELLRDITVVLRVSRPSTARYDRVYNDIPVQDGWYTADIDITLPGLWDISVTVAQGDRSIELEERIFAEKE